MTDDHGYANPIYQKVSPICSFAANTAASFQMSAIFLRTIHHASLPRHRWIVRFGDGSFGIVLAIMSISAVTHMLLANLPTPVIMDEITGIETYPLRWVEWIVLAFSLTFITESLDARHYAPPFGMACLTGTGCCAGLLLPFCSNYPIVWSMILFVGMCTCGAVFPRFYYTTKWEKENIITRMQKKSFTGRLIRVTNKLRLSWIVIWSLILLNWFLFWGLEWFTSLDNVPPTKAALHQLCNMDRPNAVWKLLLDRQFRRDAQFTVDCFLDTLSKLIFCAAVFEQYSLCLDHCNLIEDRFIRLNQQFYAEFKVKMDKNHNSPEEICDQVREQLNAFMSRNLKTDVSCDYLKIEEKYYGYPYDFPNSFPN